MGWIVTAFKVFIRVDPVLAAFFLFIFDLPRDFLSFFAVAIERFLHRYWRRPPAEAGSYAIVIPAHNGGGGLLATIKGLRTQTIAPQQIIVVSDGSTDETAAIITHAREQGLIDIAIINDRRMGVAASCNKALLFVTADCVLFLDADAELESDACGYLLAALRSEKDGAVSGNIAIRNAKASLWTAIQQIEYMIAIDFGRSFLDKFNAIACCSGAMTMFRTSALRAIGGFDAGSGQDLEVTLRLRRAGYRARFASRAWCYTDGPETFLKLVRQRLRWDRDAIRIHVFQHKQFRRSSEQESLGNTIQRYDFINFTFIPTILFPLFPISLITLPAGAMVDFLLGGYLILVGMTFLNLAVVFSAHRRSLSPYLLLLLPIFPLYQGTIMKAVRLWAYISETVWHASRNDGFVPARIRSILYRD